MMLCWRACPSHPLRERSETSMRYHLTNLLFSSDTQCLTYKCQFRVWRITWKHSHLKINLSQKIKRVTSDAQETIKSEEYKFELFQSSNAIHFPVNISFDVKSYMPWRIIWNFAFKTSSTLNQSARKDDYYVTRMKKICVFRLNTTLLNWRLKSQLNATCYFIVLLIGSTCFGHYYIWWWA